MPLLIQPVAILYSISLAFTLLPGAAVSLAVGNRQRLTATSAIILALASSATIGYLAFWVYLASKPAGRAFSLAVILISAFVILNHLRRHRQLRRLAAESAQPFAYVLIAGICYLLFFYIFSDPFHCGADLANYRFSNDVRPGDNLIPLFFAEKIYARQPLSPICCGDWLSSDRPPLQAGMFLLQRPFRILGNVGLEYQTTGTALQCLWICGVWVVLTTLRTHTVLIQQALVFLIFSGFLFYNSVYVWPKLLAATFMLFTLAILLKARRNARPLTPFEATLAAATFALAILAHPGAAFTTPGLAIVFPWGRGTFRFSNVAGAVIVFLLFFAPWMAYQKFYDPPGNRLSKMHLAGVIPVDGRSAWEAIKDSYTRTPAHTTVEYKLRNFATLVGPKFFTGYGLDERARIAQRTHISNALGILNLGWLIAIILSIRRKRQSAVPGAALLAGIALVNLATWSLILFGPAYTVTDHSSYADLLIVSIGLLGFILTAPRIIIVAAFAWQLVNFFLVWICFTPIPLPRPDNTHAPPELHWPTLVCATVCAVALIAGFLRTLKIHSPSSAPASPSVSEFE